MELRKGINEFLLINMTNFDFGVNRILSYFRVLRDNMKNIFTKYYKKV
ncbi:Uncharacterised protein [Myroides odoratimimus]|uniref:Uncharacterized protein n=1 Tax=Myroides odoratimimus CCUG 10230 TaxID=883150 RepID=A0ABP2N722_9FLAO|nr:hypothetical protein MYRA21_0509 [Myroides sp. A21]EHO05885.1 hypothetical protein HMPREF9712_03461 [Myroides odoratimimus CCUG 10230]STZ49833.1 Uncharacterised protein [Myroides odoratimimus]